MKVYHKFSVNPQGGLIVFKQFTGELIGEEGLIESKTWENFLIDIFLLTYFWHHSNFERGLLERGLNKYLLSKRGAYRIGGLLERKLKR